MAAFIGHRSFNTPDYGIGAADLFLIGVGGALLVWISLMSEKRASDAQYLKGMREVGFTDEEIEQIGSL